MGHSVLKFVIVGHVDHGKSTLIGRLLYDTQSLPLDKIEEIKKASCELGRETEFAYLLDHLEEERRQGVTIDTTQVFFKTDKRRYVIIDAPGHIEFVKNMITGASQAEAAVLTVDVKEGVKEQTRRHAYFLSLLGLNQVIVVINKMDLAGYKEEEFNEVRSKIEEFLNSINIKPLFCIPMSALQGENIAKKSAKLTWYKGSTFLESLDALQNKISPENKPLIFSVQDIYRIGEKRIVAGRIEAGWLQKGSDIKILPSNQVSRVKSIEKFLQDTDKAYAGQSIGITTHDALFINRGDIICSPGKEPFLTQDVSANIFWMSPRPLNKGQKIAIRCSTQETTGKIEEIKKRIDSSSLKIIEEDANILENLEVGEVTIKTKNPIAVKDFSDVQELGRFVLTQDENICAGGIVIIKWSQSAERK